MGYNIKQMEELGISDYYLALNKYIGLFIDRNYPLSKEDMSAIVNGGSTDNVAKRNEYFQVLRESMNNILIKEVEENKRKLAAWKDGKYLAAITSAQEQQKIFEFIQLMLEDLWNYQNKDIKNNTVGNGRK